MGINPKTMHCGILFNMSYWLKLLPVGRNVKFKDHSHSANIAHHSPWIVSSLIFLQLNHFQTVFMTDGTYTFVKFNYPEDGINWAYPGMFGFLYGWWWCYWFFSLKLFHQSYFVVLGASLVKSIISVIDNIYGQKYWYVDWKFQTSLYVELNRIRPAQCWDLSPDFV